MLSWAASETPEATASIAIFIGRFHPLIVHLPIGLVSLLFLLELLSRFQKLAIAPNLLQILLWLSFGSSIASVVVGYLLSTSGDYDVELLSLHMYNAYVMSALILAALISFKIYLNKEKKIWQNSYSLFIYSSFVLLMVVGHYGGSLTHGATYLTEYAPWNKKAERKKITNINEALVFPDLILPILEKKCISCHNASKIKGGLRMDEYEKLIAGGEHKDVIVAGKPEDSDLYKLAILPKTEKRAMPPDGKVGLSNQELEIIYWWIEAGAANTQTVASLKPSPKTLQLLQQYFLPAENTSALEKIKVDAVTNEQLTDLRKKGVQAIRLGKDDQKLQVQFLEPSQTTNAELKNLSSIKNNVVYLDLARTAITNDGIKEIGAMKNLNKLYLQETKITDGASNVYGTFKQLEILNFYNTAITDKTLEALSACSTLKKIFLWKTATTKVGQDKLRKALPNLTIDIGLDSTKIIMQTDTLKKI